MPSNPAVADPSRGARAGSERLAALPTPLTAFVGREKVLATVQEHVRSSRLVTLVGPGGCGKTRLCIEAARALEGQFDESVAWVELAALTDASLVAPTIALALGLRQQASQAPAEQLAAHLAGRRTLVVLDNCEHVIAEAAEVAGLLLAASPGVQVLATSRERLGVRGERSLQVPPLGLPSVAARDLDAVLGAEAVRLFLERATAVQPVFAVDEDAASAIAEICVRLDGIPLAIELAAARMNVLTPQQIAARLADSMALLTTGARTTPARQRTLRGAIDWSHQLLPEPERVLFRRLAVFGGTFSLDAAEAVCGDVVLPGHEVLDTLAGLADKSLVTVRERDGEARYRLLDAVRQYAAEQLDAAGETDALRQRHADFFAALVAHHAPQLRSPARPRAVALIDAELDNIRAALDWSRTTPGFALLHHRILASLWWYWLYRVLWDEGLQRFGLAIGAAMDGLPDDAVADTLYGAGMLAWLNGQHLQARVWLERCVALRRDNPSAAGNLGMALCSLAQATVDLGDVDSARALATEGLALARQHCAPWDVAASATALGYVMQVTGDMDAAEEAYREADAIWSDPPDHWSRSLSRNSLAVLSWRRGRPDAAEAYARDSLAGVREIGDRWFAARTLLVLGFLALQRGDLRRAVAMMGASESMRREVGARLMPFEAPHWEQALNALRAALGPAFDAAWHEATALVFAEAVEMALGDVAAPAVTALPAAPVTPPAAPVAPAASQPPAAVVIQALGTLRVWRDGRLLTNEDWTYSKPRELLMYLLSHPDGKTRDQIGLDLWPEASPARLRSSFHVTMHHVRRVLGAAEWVAYEGGRYRFVAAEATAYDVTSFLATLDRAAALDGEARLQVLEEAVAVWQGDYLDDAGFGSWSDAVRDDLRRRFIDACIAAGTLHLAAGRADTAADRARRVLATDNLDERAHRLLMESHAAAGRSGDALRHFNTLTILFREELGAPPSPETAEIARRLGAEVVA